MIQPLQQQKLNEKALEECNKLHSDTNVDSRVIRMVTRAEAKKMLVYRVSQNNG